MPLGKGQRKVVRVLGGGVAVLALLLVSLPLWFPWVLRPLAHRQGVDFSSYGRLSYSRFAVNGVRLTNQSTRISAARLEGLVPTAWLWRLATKSRLASEPFASANNWEFESIPGQAPSQTQLDSAYDQVRKLANTFYDLQRWLPSAFLSNGIVRIGQTRIIVPSLDWSNGVLRAGASQSIKGREVSLGAQLNTAPPFELRVRADELHLDSSTSLRRDENGLNIQSTNFWWSNRLEVLAHFGRNGLLPETAKLSARDFTLPREVAGIPNYQDLTGSLIGNWNTGKFSVEINARAQPVIDKTNLPPLDAVVRVHGDTNAATVETLDVNSPALTARLSNPVAVHFSGTPLQQPVAMTLQADLGKQTWLPLTGRLAGRAEFTPTTTQIPQVQFRLFGREVGNGNIKARILRLDAQCNWPFLDISSVNASFEDGSVADLKGKLDLEQKSVTQGQIRFNGPLVRQWLPYGFSYETLALSGNFEGPLEHLRHSGHLEAAHITSPETKPLTLKLDWQGQQEHIEQFNVHLASTNASLSAAGELALTNRFGELALSSLSLAVRHRALLELKEPARFSARQDASNQTWQVIVTPFKWEGAGGQVSCSATLDWPKEGVLQLSIRNLSSTNFAEFLKRALPEAQIGALQAAASWTNGPVDFAFELSTVGRAAGAIPDRNSALKSKPRPTESGQAAPLWETLLAEPVAADLRLSGDRTGITLSNLVVKTQGTQVLAVHGFVPITIHPATLTNLVNLEAQHPLRLSAVVEPQAVVWDQLEDWTGVILDEPELKLNVSGTWRDLAGDIAFQAKQLSLFDQPSTMPSVQNIQFQVSLNRQEAQLTKGDLQVQSQPVSLTAQMPLGEDFWIGLKNKKRLDWQQATARLQIRQAKLAAFEPLFPELLAPQGELDADLKLSPGAKLSGTLTIQGARTRPLSDLGPIRDINVQLECQNRFLQLENASAKIGGAPIDFSGGVDFKGTNWLRGALPPFQISVHGKDVPLSRQPESIIRGDLLLGIIKTNGAPPLISGVAHLRESFYLSDLSALVPGKVASPSTRPPYFSIQEPILADWRLGVGVDGVRFLSVRSTIFNGKVSANLTLTGTLKDPIALGDLKIDSGLVRFPFANLQVQQGLVNLTSQDPYHPQLLVSAISKQFGYDIRMEVSGTADTPIIQFTSNPPLSSEQIVLLITAGQMPQGAYTLTAQQRAQTVALFLGSDLLTKLGFGDQTEQRLIIHSGEQISTQGKPTYDVEYKLTPRWAVTAEYDRFGDYNAGLKWRIYSK